MKETGSGNGAPGVDRTSSWADETLPLGLRKELLARELQKLGARRKKDAGPSASDPDLTGRKGEKQSRERGS